MLLPLRHEPRSVHPSELLEDHRRRLRTAGESLYDARAAFLGEQFDGYAADTYHVEGVGYVCWPAATDGRFDAYDDLVAAEADALAPLLDAGFERVGVGLSRVGLRSPGGDHVVKLSRCGMAALGDGRRANLLEARLSAMAGDAAPVVPSLHCEPRGSFAVYPFVERSGGAASGAPDVAGTVAGVRDWLAGRAPWLDLEEATAPENRCVWRGRLRTLDYSFPAGERVLGVPGHVDHDRVVAAVDEQRRGGSKRDLLDGGGFVEPEVDDR